MKNIFRCLGIIMVILVIGFTMGACDNGSTGGGGIPILPIPPSPLTGNWQGNVVGYPSTFTVNATFWIFSVPGVYSDTGTYTMKGSTAEFWCQGLYIGTGTLQDSNTIQVVLNRNAAPVPPGTYKFTRVSS